MPRPPKPKTKRARRQRDTSPATDQEFLTYLRRRYGLRISSQQYDVIKRLRPDQMHTVFTFEFEPPPPGTDWRVRR